MRTTTLWWWWLLSALAIVLGLAVVRADPEPESKPEPDAEVAAYEKHVVALRKKLPDEGKGFTIVVQKPFVVAGDEAPARVRLRAEKTVKWAVDLLEKDYFPKPPAHILDIFLFRDDASYREHAKALFDHTPTSPYGYYSAADRALVMNIATGGGTLVHEMVHAYQDTNFPTCPTWFEEGLASLYEQCGVRDGHIVGHPNWRLPIIQKAIREGVVASFADLCAYTSREFYGAQRGVNYAQARYLCYYLQEKGLLRRFYEAFKEKRAEDPTGYATLVRILEEEDMTAFQEQWEAYVLTLRRS